ncbi:hypothetical protein HDR61_04510 [bacterium]|nr:hypothetical protein [bacterium]
MKTAIAMVIVALGLGACNSISVKEKTLEPGSKIYAARGGYTMRRSIKDELERHGHIVLVGKAVLRESYDTDGNEVTSERDKIPGDTRYYVSVRERREKFRPIWCSLNGFWWWNFSVSIADQQTGEELMTWRGRGCADSSMRLLRKTLDKMEKTNGDGKH